MEKQMRDYFLSCDWGTSSFRLKLVNWKAKRILAVVENSQGIKKAFLAWEGSESEDRIVFYQNTLKEAITQLVAQTDIEIKYLPIILSGMASSSIGIQELPYANLPILLDVKNLVINHIASTEDFTHDIYLASGLQKEGDVMRGEEMQAIGWAQNNDLLTLKCTLIFPGTHSKHLYLVDGKLVDFKTYMTGELFELFSKHSILKNSIASKTKWSSEAKKTFANGVLDSQKGNLSNLLFTIRAKDLQGSINKVEANYYLSGLLIGNELKKLKTNQLILLGDSKFESLYKLALETLAYKNYEIIKPQKVENLVVWGHIAVLNII